MRLSGVQAIAGLLLLSLAAVTACHGASADTASVVVDGKALTGEIPAFRREGHTMVPIRELAATLDSPVHWDEESREVILETGPFPLVLNPGEPVAHWGPETLRLDPAPDLRDGRAFLSLEAVAEWMGLPVLWDANENTAYLHTGKEARQVCPSLYQGLEHAFQEEIERVRLLPGQIASPQVIVDTFAQIWLDRPEFFHLGPQMRLEGRNLQLEYTYSGAERKALETELDQAAQHLVQNATSPDMGERQRLEALHDAVIDNTSYRLAGDEGKAAPRAHTAYGLLVEREGVCSGYASALKMVLERSGIQSEIVTGSSNGIPHAWNLVEIDGERGHVDATWNASPLDPDSGRDYFNLDDESLSRTHTWDRGAYPEALSF